MEKKNVLNWSERRIKRRHKAPGLKVKIRSTGLKSWFSSSLSVSCLDINRYGMAINSPRQFKPKDTVIIGFKGKYIIQSNIPGVVSESIETEEGYRTSIVFSYAIDSKHYCRKTDNALSRIESLYNNCQESRAS